MQHALTDADGRTRSADDRGETDADRGIAALMASRKAKLWDAYVARWQAKVRREGSGLVDAFMLLSPNTTTATGSEMCSPASSELR